jgi:FKBP-type peptidyl-prolyl cis-trans isomerase
MLAIAAAVLIAGCAPQETKPPPVAVAPKPACAPAPQDLVVKDLKPGTGREVKFRTAVMVSYTGWLYDGCAADLKGAKFDSSEDRNAPFAFMVGAGNVIKGWDEGLIGMKEKGKRLLVIPPDKAYGSKGAGGGLIQPNATLVFEIELFQIVYQPVDTKK